MKVFDRVLVAGVAFALLLACIVSCNGDESVQDDGNYSVEGVILKAVEVAAGDVFSFDCLKGVTVQMTDKAIFHSVSTEQEYECRIVDVTSSKLKMMLPEGIVSGEYKLYIVHDGHSYQVPGTMRLTVLSNREVLPEDGATVYGLVSCGGRGIEGVVVSDGHEVVLTDSDGVYQLPSAKVFNDVALNVFVSVPSGYEPLHDGILPLSNRLLSADPAPERVDFELVKVDGQDKHTMLMFGDMHLANRNSDVSQFSKFRSEIIEYTSSHASEHVYGMTLGDMTWDLYWYSNAFNLSNYVQTMSSVKDLIIYHTMGNHDYDIKQVGDDFTTQPFRKIIGPTYYSYNAGKVHYVVIDDILTKNTGAGDAASRIYTNEVTDYQVEWLKKDLQHVSKDTPIVLTMHAPLFNENGGNAASSASNTRMLEALKGYRTHIFSAHTHVVYNIDRLEASDYYEHNSGAVCATWWWTGKYNSGIHISTDGTPGGYYIVDVDGTDLKWQYKATNHPIDYQMRAYDRNTIVMTAENWCPNATDERKTKFLSDASSWVDARSDNMVYFNVWAYDPSWTIKVTEDGKELEWKKISIKDPLHLVAYEAERFKNNGDSSFDTRLCTSHMFRVQASAPNTTLEFTLTDRFGNVYNYSMARPLNFSLAAYK